MSDVNIQPLVESSARMISVLLGFVENASETYIV